MRHDATQAPPQPSTVREPQPTLRQSVAALQLGDSLLKLCIVVEATGLSVATIYRKMAEGDFPQPVRLGSRCSRWRAGDVTGWLKSKSAAA